MNKSVEEIYDNFMGMCNKLTFEHKLTEKIAKNRTRSRTNGLYENTFAFYSVQRIRRWLKLVSLGPQRRGGFNDI